MSFINLQKRSGSLLWKEPIISYPESGHEEWEHVYSLLLEGVSYFLLRWMWCRLVSLVAYLDW